MNDGTQGEGTRQLLAFRHHLQDDHAFLKVLGVCVSLSLLATSCCLCVFPSPQWPLLPRLQVRTEGMASPTPPPHPLPLSPSPTLQPYGSVLPGAVVRFSTKDRLGHQKTSVCTLTSGPALHLPFIVFGLGQTPSLVEELQVTCGILWSSWV